MSTFYMSSDRYFVGGWEISGSPILWVVEASSDDDCETSNAKQIGPNQRYSELEICGQRFQGQRLRQLATDLLETHCYVNRQGYCFYNYTVVAGTRFLEIFRTSNLRLNDLFPWPKYGVYPSYSTSWTRRDLSTGITLVNNDQDTISELRDKLSRCESSLQQKEKELRDSRSEVTKLEKEASKHKKDLQDKEKIIKDEQKTIDDLNDKVVSLIDVVTAFNDLLQNL